RFYTPVSRFHPAMPPPSIAPLPLHDALPCCRRIIRELAVLADVRFAVAGVRDDDRRQGVAVGVTLTPIVVTNASHGEAYIGEDRSEEHTSELQSRAELVCRLPLEKNK